jgi:hypothetical protein
MFLPDENRGAWPIQGGVGLRAKIRQKGLVQAPPAGCFCSL